jgi:hypothetical protein
MAMAMRALRLVVDTGGEGRRRGRPAVAPSVPVLRYATPQSLTARQAWINKIHSRGRLGCRPRPWRGLGGRARLPTASSRGRQRQRGRQAGRAYLLSMPRQTPHPQPPPPTNPAVHACSGSSGGHAVQVDWSTN